MTAGLPAAYAGASLLKAEARSAHSPNRQAARDSAMEEALAQGWLPQLPRMLLWTIGCRLLASWVAFPLMSPDTPCQRYWVSKNDPKPGRETREAPVSSLFFSLLFAFGETI